MSSTNVGSIHYDLGLDTAQFDRAAEGINKKISGIADTMSDMGKKMTAGVTLPVIAGFSLMVKAASDLNETMNKIDVAFADQAKTVKDWAKSSINSMGLAEQSALDAAALFGDMSTAMGLTTIEAKDMSTGLVQLGADMASFKNVSFERAQTALAGVYTGETEALKGLGIVMTETNLEAFAMSQGITKNIKDMTQAEKVQLRYAYVMSVTKNAQGDFARTSDGTANQIRITTERFKDLSASLGQELLPYANRVLAWAQDAIRSFKNLSSEQQRMVLGTLAFAAAAGPLLITLSALARTISILITSFRTITTAIVAARVAFVAFSASMALNPIGLVALAVGALVGGLIALTSATNSNTSASERLKVARENLTNATNAAKDAENALTDANLNLEGSNLRVERAQLSYNKAVRQYGPNSLEAREAAYQLRTALNDQAAAANAVKDRTNEAAAANKNLANQKEAFKNANNEIANSAANAANRYGTFADRVNAATRAMRENNQAEVANQIFGVPVTGSGGAGMTIPRRASGGPVSANRPYWVGDNKDGSLNRTSELFVPKQSGTIMNQKQLSGIGHATNIYGDINIQGNDEADYFFSRIDRMQERALMGLTP